MQTLLYVVFVCGWFGADSGGRTILGPIMLRAGWAVPPLRIGTQHWSSQVLRLHKAYRMGPSLRSQLRRPKALLGPQRSLLYPVKPLTHKNKKTNEKFSNNTASYEK